MSTKHPKEIYNKHGLVEMVVIFETSRIALVF